MDTPETTTLVKKLLLISITVVLIVLLYGHFDQEKEIGSTNNTIPVQMPVGELPEEIARAQRALEEARSKEVSDREKQYISSFRSIEGLVTAKGSNFFELKTQSAPDFSQVDFSDSQNPRFAKFGPKTFKVIIDSKTRFNLIGGLKELNLNSRVGIYTAEPLSSSATVRAEIVDYQGEGELPAPPPPPGR